MRALTLRIGLLLLALLTMATGVEATKDPLALITDHIDCIRDGPYC